MTGGAGGNTTLAEAALGKYAGPNLGLGVCNQNEGTNCSTPNHEVDNNGRLDFILFQFKTAVITASVVLNPVCNCGYPDSTYYLGTGSAAISGISLAQLSTVGFGSATNRSGGNSEQSFAFGGSGVTSILLGADIGGPHLGNDYFKIGSLAYSAGASQPKPEPVSVALVGGGLIGMYLIRRRRP
jgi:hypothetical protein